MKKISIVLILCLAVCLGVIFAGCSSSYGPIGSKEYKNEAAVNNGGLVVQQGKYIYYVNGMDATANITKPEHNAFGKASVKGSIMKSKIDENGNLSETAVVVPKMFYTSAANGGFYIYGEWIYYMSPNTKTDNKSNVLSSQSVAMRTKIDGTKTQEITTLSSDSIQYVFTKDAFVYYENNSLKKVGYTSSKVNKKSETVASKIESVTFTAKSTKVFFIKATDSNKRLNDNMFVYADGKVQNITTDTTYDSENDKSQDNLKKQYSFDILSYDEKQNTLFYTKQGNDNDANKSTSTYAYTFGDSYALTPANEVRYSTTALTGSNIIYLGKDKGILYTADTGLKIYSQISETAIEDNTQDYVTLKTSGAEIVKIDADDIYYILSNTIYKMNVEEGIEYKISEDAISTSWLTRSVIGKYLYYIDNTYNYMFRMDLGAFNDAPNKTEFAKGEIVSGTRKAVLSKDKDGKITIKYVKDSENNEDVTYCQIPKFMTSADAQKYAENIYDDIYGEKK